MDSVTVTQARLRTAVRSMHSRTFYELAAHINTETISQTWQTQTLRQINHFEPAVTAPFCALRHMLKAPKEYETAMKSQFSHGLGLGN